MPVNQVKYKISTLAKELEIKNKELLDTITNAGLSGKTQSGSLDETEFNIVLELLTSTHQVDSMDAYMNKEVIIEAPQKPEPAREEVKEAGKGEKTDENTEQKDVEKKPQTPAFKPKVKEAPMTKLEKFEKFRNGAAAQPQKNEKKAEQRRDNRDTRQSIKPTTGAKGEVKFTDDSAVKSGKGSQRIVDTRTSTVDLSKYDERLESFVDHSKKNFSPEKQKIKNKGRDSFSRDREKEKERLAMEKLKKLNFEKAKKQQLTVHIPDEISVSELAVRLKVTAAEVVKRLMMLGVMANVNMVIDYDTAYLVADELGAKVEKEVVVTIEEKLFDEAEDNPENLVQRSPVVVVMGHVDHGKTSILDAIRHTNVTTGEAGGITQHIGAYRVNVKGKDITFLDTPGHAAFTAMRARGAMATDIAILVVAADDGIMPQTVEAINHAKAAGIEIIVAINKMDKHTANPDAVKQELTKYELVPEEWGGDVICVPVSALTKMGIDDLLENVLLVAEMKELKANPNRRAKGIIIEAKLDRGRGPVATVLVQNGTLNSGDIVIAGTSVGRVRAMTDENGRRVHTAGPSVPVEITGLAEVPEAGDEFAAVEDERMARELAEQRKAKIKEDSFKANSKANLDDLFAQIAEGVKELNIIIKADVGGSAEAVKASLVKLSNDEVKVKVIHSAVGGITEGDVMLASASNAIIIGFNVRPDKTAIDSAEEKGVDIRTYRIIYECIDEVEAAMKGMLAPKFKEVVLGHAEVRQTIHVPNVGTIAGSYVQDGKVTRNSEIRVVRDGVVIFEDKISSLKRFKDDAKEVLQGYECGIGLEKFNDIKVGDILEAYEMQEVERP
ncbi:MAG: translation initiation factor IF-2 [Ruminococcaceae bacterium]|nr:translation initiation factor IF-2 [Oscillospiraceae bacterium]